MYLIYSLRSRSPAIQHCTRVYPMHSLRSWGMQPRARSAKPNTFRRSYKLNPNRTSDRLQAASYKLYEGVPNALATLMGHATPRPTTIPVLHPQTPVFYLSHNKPPKKSIYRAQNLPMVRCGPLFSGSDPCPIPCLIFVSLW
jgi:hypothetical protein